MAIYTIGSKPAHAIISRDNNSLWVSDFGGGSSLALQHSMTADDPIASIPVHNWMRLASPWLTNTCC